MPRRKAERVDHEGRLLLLLQDGPVSWTDVPLSMASAAVALVESGAVEMFKVGRRAYLRLPKETAT